MEFPIDPLGFKFSSIRDFRAVLSLFCLIGFATFIFATRRKMPVLSFGLLWYFLALSPSSGLANTTQPINYHRPYIAIPGLCCAAVAVLFYLWNYLSEKFDSKYVVIGIVWIILAILGWNILIAREQNKIWGDKEKLWEVAVKYSPSSGRAQMNLGVEYMKKANYDKAEQKFNECARLCPYYSYVYVNLGILYNARGEYEKADMAFLKAYNIWPKHKIIVKWYAKHFTKRKKYPDVVKALNGVINDKPESAEFLLMRGIAFYNMNQYQKAVNDITKAEKILPENNKTILFLSLSLINLQRYSEAYNLLDKWIDSHKNDYTALFNKAYASMKMEKYKRACDEWQAFLKIKPHSSKAVENLNACKIKLKENHNNSDEN